MVSSQAKSVKEYLQELPKERRRAIETVRKVILDNLPQGYQEGIQYGMISYYIPLEDYPDTYNGQPLNFAALASQKNYMSLYLNSVYGNPELAEWFKEKYLASGKKLDMGKSCIRFRVLEDLPLELIGETIARTPKDVYLRYYKHLIKPD